MAFLLVETSFKVNLRGCLLLEIFPSSPRHCSLFAQLIFYSLACVHAASSQQNISTLKTGTGFCFVLVFLVSGTQEGLDKCLLECNEWEKSLRNIVPQNIYTDTYIHAHMHAYIHAYIHACMHTYIYFSSFLKL